MKFKTMVAGLLAATLLSQGAALAAPADTGSSDAGALTAAGLAYLDGRTPASKIRVPGPRTQQEVRPQVQLAQMGDPRVNQLEEQIRRLNGQLEEMNFQILQMQEQVRKQQEDIEFRLQEMENRGGGGAAPASTKGNASGANKRTELTPPAGGTLPPVGGSQTIAGVQQPGSIEQIIETPAGTNALPPVAAAPNGAGATSPNGAPPRTLGTVTFDANGNARQSTQAPAPAGQTSAGVPGVQTGPTLPRTDGTQVAALPQTGNPDDLYRSSYEFVMSGDYALAETGFKDHIARFPSDQRSADARFWLGEALLGQQKYREAAQTFLAANKEFPQAKKAPDTMLKLGISLAAMQQRDVACATLAEVARKYPSASAQILDRAKQERQKAAC